MSIRLYVLENSLKIETMISNYLCALLDVPPDTSKLFGEKSTALPINTKIALLLEIDYFDETKKDKFLKFFEIRNKFAHLESVTNYTTCVERIDGLERKLLKWYPEMVPENYDSKELWLHRLYLKLSIDVLGDINAFLDFYTKKINSEYKLQYEARFYSHYSKVLDKLAENDPDLYESLKKARHIALAETKEMPEFRKPRYLKAIDDKLKKN